jgi:hypothetical protein
MSRNDNSPFPIPLAAELTTIGTDQGEIIIEAELVITAKDLATRKSTTHRMMLLPHQAHELAASLTAAAEALGFPKPANDSLP